MNESHSPLYAYGVALLVALCPVSPTRAAEEQPLTLRYRFHESQEFTTLSREQMESLPTPDAPNGVQIEQIIVMQFTVLSVARSGDAEVRATLEYLSVRMPVGGTWKEVENATRIPEAERTIQVTITPRGKTRPQTHDRARNKPEQSDTPSGALDLPTLPAEPIIMGASWVERDRVSRPGVEGVFHRRTVGRWMPVDEDSSPHEAILNYDILTHGEDLPLEMEHPQTEGPNLRAKLSETMENRIRSMRFDTQTGMPRTIQSVATRDESRVAVLSVEGGEELSGKKALRVQTNSINRTGIYPGRRDVETLLLELERDEFYHVTKPSSKGSE